MDAVSFAETYASRTYRFFKTQGEISYTAEDFAVSVGGISAESVTD